MSRKQIVVCDRCGVVTDEASLDRNDWSLALDGTLSGRELVGTSECPAELCGDCTSELRAFMLPPPTTAPDLPDVAREPPPPRRARQKLSEVAK